MLALMKKTQMKTILKQLGWSQARLARRLGITPHAVSRWGETIPQYAAEYLLTIAALREIVENGKRG